VVQGPTDDDIALAKLAVDQAKNALWAAQASRDGICGNKHNADYLCDAADAQAPPPRRQCSRAQEKLAQLQAGSSEEAIAQAKSAVDAAQAQLELAQQPASSEDLAQAQDAVRLAEAQLALAKDPVTTHDLAAAAAQVAAAQAQYDALNGWCPPGAGGRRPSSGRSGPGPASTSNVQLAKATITTPLDGQILTRSVEPGEIVAASSPLFVIGNLQSLEITVYLPEEEYARVTVGDTAELTVDPYPSRVFTATITHIADEAEFTPRSVQTEEGRKDTVFAVRLSIANPDLASSPGCPPTSPSSRIDSHGATRSCSGCGPHKHFGRRARRGRAEPPGACRRMVGLVGPDAQARHHQRLLCGACTPAAPCGWPATRRRPR
jgi:multidrug resistance efflux pump